MSVGKRAVILATECPRCGAQPGQSCRTPKGKPLPPHNARRTAAPITLEQAYASAVDPDEQLGLRLAMERYNLLQPEVEDEIATGNDVCEACQGAGSSVSSSHGA